MRKSIATIWLSLSGLLVASSFAQATDMTSPNFKDFDSSFAPAAFSAASPNFTVNGSLEPIVDVSVSTNFTVQHGVPITDTSTPTPPPPPPPSGGGGGGGGSGGGPAASTGTQPVSGNIQGPTLEYRSPTFFSHQILSGKRAAETDLITVNGSSNGVSLLPELGWKSDLPLFVGYNDVRVQALGRTGGASSIIGGQIERLLIGDASRSKGPTFHHVVDDVDLSLFTRAWKTYDFYSDFNEDTLIDDADLSLLVSHWGLTADY